MAYELPMPRKLRKQGWKAKISDKERLEPPHVTIIFKTSRWRWDLRNRRFMDKVPDPDDVPDEVLDVVEAGYGGLCDAWDEMYPENRVKEESGDD